MSYSTSKIITQNTWNNALSFDQRKRIFGKATNFIPSLKQIHHISEIELGTHIVMEEVDQYGKSQSHTGLAHVYQLMWHSTPIVIFDNHNHALYFRLTWKQSHNIDGPILLDHIDQHSDLNTPDIMLEEHKLDNEAYIYDYVQHQCQISNFINPFLHCFPETQFQWIKTQDELLDHTHSPWTPYILDIDLDFRAPEMNTSQLHGTIARTQDLISQADLVTIASSPMFIDQSHAIDLLHTLFTPNNI